MGTTVSGVYEFFAAVWVYPGDNGWHFITVPPEVSDDISERTAGLRHGFGSVRVQATIGETTWQTSVFPDSKTGTYLLPIKKSVRAAEELTEGTEVRLLLECHGVPAV